MTNDIAITVIITTYNLEVYIGRCLEDLQKQTFSSFDILVVDDASSDSTCLILEKWAEVFGPKINIIYLKENLGLPALTRNVALDSGMISGQYVLFLDGDDRIEEDMLEKMYSKAIRDDSDVVICAYDRVCETSGKVLNTEMMNFPNRITLPADKDSIPYINTSPWNKLWKYDIIKYIRFSNFRVGEEVFFNFKAYININNGFISFLDERLIHYNVRTASVISNTDEETIYKFADELKEMVVTSSEEYRPIAEVLYFFHIGLSMALRAAENKNINLNYFVDWNQAYLKKMDYFSNNKYLKFSYLRKKGVKGYFIFVALLAYRLGWFEIGLKAYRALGIDIKF